MGRYAIVLFGKIGINFTLILFYVNQYRYAHEHKITKMISAMSESYRHYGKYKMREYCLGG